MWRSIVRAAGAWVVTNSSRLQRICLGNAYLRQGLTANAPGRLGVGRRAQKVAPEFLSIGTKPGAEPYLRQLRLAHDESAGKSELIGSRPCRNQRLSCSSCLH